MSGECATAAVNVLLKYVKDPVIGYVSYIKDYDKKMKGLGEKLGALYKEKGRVDGQVETGKKNLHKAKGETENWLGRVQELITKRAELKKLISADINIAHHVVLLMGPHDLNQLLEEDKKMGYLVVALLKQPKDVEGYNNVAGTVVDMMLNATVTLKQIIKEDSVIAKTTSELLSEDVLASIKSYDEELGMVLEGANSTSTSEVSDYKTSKNVTEGLMNPLEDLLEPLRDLLGDKGFTKGMPRGVPEGLKFGLQVMGGLLSAGLKKNMKQRIIEEEKGCCLGAIINSFNKQYELSKEAENLANYIEMSLLKECPKSDQVTEAMSSDELVHMPSEIMDGLESREILLKFIMEKLQDDHNVNSVALFGIGGGGKTTLVKKVAEERAKLTFKTIVFVEISADPSVERIQRELSEKLSLTLVGGTIRERADKLFNRILVEKPDDSTRSRDKKSGILIVLDNIWDALDLTNFGIPKDENWCKILVTSRFEGVCKDMGVEDENMFNVGLLTEREAWLLFQNKVSTRLEKDGYKDVAKRLVKKCRRLPLAVVGIADLVKNKSLSDWLFYEEELKKSMSNELSGHEKAIYSILELSFKHMKHREMKWFFFMACLFPLGSPISVRDLLRCGIGLKLFQDAQDIAEATRIANRWVHELVSSSLFLLEEASYEQVEYEKSYPQTRLSSSVVDKECPRFVKIHDIVRATAISTAKTDKFMHVLETIPQFGTSVQEYTALSLTPGATKQQRTRIIKSDRLKMLVINGNEALSLPGDFFQGITSLEVLVMTKMNFKVGLPTSLRNLKDLRTLHLEDCKLGDTSLVGELTSLLVLSLRGSQMNKLPEEIKKLVSLDTLDLSGCDVVETIPASLILSLTELGTLHMCSNFQGFANASDQSSEKATANCLSYLSSLEMHFQDIQELATNNYEFVRNLDQFCLLIGDTRQGSVVGSCILTISNFELSQLVDCYCLEPLITKVECLKLLQGKGFKYLLSDEFINHGFKELKLLKIRDCPGMVSIVNTQWLKKANHGLTTAFPRLESLVLYSLEDLEEICGSSSEFRTGIIMFHSLRSVQLHQLPRLSYLLPIGPTYLTEIIVEYCGALQVMFMEQTQVIHALPWLKLLQLDECPNLTSLWREQQVPHLAPTTSDHPQGRKPPLLNVQVPSLEQLRISNIGMASIWDLTVAEGITCYNSCFKSLKIIQIIGCDKLKNLGSPHVAASLVQLESLIISDCKNMTEIICEELQQCLIPDQPIIIKFTKLKYLQLMGLINLKCFYGGSYRLHFPALQELVFLNLHAMTAFNGPQDSAAFFAKIEFPALKKFECLSKMHNPSKKEASGTPFMKFNKLEELHLSETSWMEELLVVSPKCKSSYTKEGAEEDACSSSTLLFYGQLRKLNLEHLQSSRHIHNWHLFTSLSTLDISSVKWAYVISLVDELAAMMIRSPAGSALPPTMVFSHLQSIRVQSANNMRFLCNVKDTTNVQYTLSFPSLILLEVSDCQKLESIVSSGVVFHAPHLQKIELWDCMSMEYLFPGSSYGCGESDEHTVLITFPSLTDLQITTCHKLQSLSRGHHVEVPKLQNVMIDGLSYEVGALNNIDTCLRTVYDLRTRSLDNIESIPSLSSHGEQFFDEMGLQPNLLRGISTYGLKEPSVIQQRGIVPFCKGHDVLLQDRPRSGKTTTFCVGVLQQLDYSLVQCQALVLVPSREHSIRIERIMRGLGDYLGVTTHAIASGTSYREDIRIIKNGVQVVVGTPGRVLDLFKRLVLRKADIKMFVLAEVNEMTSLGYTDQIYDIVQEYLQPKTQICLSSASMPPEALELADKVMRKPIRIVVEREEESITLDGVKQFYVNVVKEEWKLETLFDLYEILPKSQSIVFVNTNRKVEWLSDKMRRADFSVSMFHRCMDQNARDLVIREFRLKGTTCILVTTDDLAIGNDIHQVSLVINYDLPAEPESYFLRIGRHKRFLGKVFAISFVTEEDEKILANIQSFYNVSVEELPADIADLLR